MSPGPTEMIQKEADETVSKFVTRKALESFLKVKGEKERVERGKICTKMLDEAILEAEDDRDRVNWYLWEGTWERRK